MVTFSLEKERERDIERAAFEFRCLLRNPMFHDVSKQGQKPTLSTSKEMPPLPLGADGPKCYRRVIFGRELLRTGPPSGVEWNLLEANYDSYIFIYLLPLVYIKLKVRPLVTLSELMVASILLVGALTMGMPLVYRKAYFLLLVFLSQRLYCGDCY